MIQRRTAALLATVMVASMTAVGCSGASTPAPSPTEAGELTGTLNISWQSTEEPALKTVVDAFMAENPGVEVKVTGASIEQYFATLPTQLSSGQGPDVFLVWAGWGNPVAQRQLSQFGYLADLSEREWVVEIPDSIQSVAESNGKTVIMPTTMLAFTTWYNDQAMKEVGLTPPADYDEVLEFCADATAKGKVAYSMGSGTLSSNSRGFNVFLPDVIGDQTTAELLEPLVSGDEKYADNDAYQDGMDRYQEMIDAGCFPQDAVSLDIEADDTMFAAGEALGSMANSNNKVAWAAKAPDTDFIVAPPTDKVLLYANKGVAVNAASKNAEIALAFVDFFATPEMRDAYAASLSGVLPAIPTDTPIDDPSLALLAEKLAAGDVVGFPQQSWEDPKMDSTLNSAIQGMFLGQSSPADVLAALDAQTEAFLGK